VQDSSCRGLGVSAYHGQAPLRPCHLSRVCRGADPLCRGFGGVPQFPELPQEWGGRVGKEVRDTSRRESEGVPQLCFQSPKSGAGEVQDGSCRGLGVSPDSLISPKSGGQGVEKANIDGWIPAFAGMTEEIPDTSWRGGGGVPPISQSPLRVGE
jgi:hypothetical protein